MKADPQSGSRRSTRIRHAALLLLIGYVAPIGGRAGAVEVHRSVTNDVAGEALVQLTIQELPAPACVTLEERCPPLLRISGITQEGAQTPTDGSLRWGPFTNVSNLTVTYRLSGLVGSFAVDGMASVNGTNYPVSASNVTLSSQGGASYSMPPQVAAPNVTPPSLSTTPVGVTISCSTTGATIRYTLDGTTPSPTSLLYTGAISVAGAGTVRARAFKQDWLPSDAVVAIYGPRSAVPQLEVGRAVAGNGSTNPLVSLAVGAPPDAQCYAVEEWLPPGLTASGITSEGILDPNGAAIRWGPFTVTGVKSLSYQAMGLTGEHQVQSALSLDGFTTREAEGTNIIIASGLGTIPLGPPPQVRSPEFNPASGAVVPVDVTISCATIGAVIRYTLDGSVPNAASPLYVSPVRLNDAGVIRARAFKEGWTPSDASVAYYAEKLEPDVQVTRNLATNLAVGPKIELTVIRGTNGFCFAAEQSLAMGLTPLNITEGGIFSPQDQKIRWGPFRSTNNLELACFLIGNPGVYDVSAAWSVDGVGGGDSAPLQVPVVTQSGGLPLILVNGDYALVHYLASASTAEVVLLAPPTSDGQFIWYSVDGNEPYMDYTGPFSVAQSCVIRAAIYDAAYNKISEATPVEIQVLPFYALTDVTQGGGVVIKTPGPGPYLANSLVTLVASNYPGWAFLRWEGDATGSEARTEVLMSSPRSVRAVFGTPLSTTAVPPASGSVVRGAADPLLPFGESIRLTAVPTGNYYFFQWQNAAAGNTNNPILFNVVTANTNVTARFYPLSGNNRSLTVIPDGPGSVLREPSLSYYQDGQTVRLTPSPAQGGEFLGWSGDAEGAANPLVVTMTSNKVLRALFSSPTPSNVPPTISLALPTEGSEYRYPVVLQLEANAADIDGMVTSVEFFSGQDRIGAVTKPPWRYSWTNPPAGSYELYARATDNLQGSSISATVSVTVHSAIPLVMITSPTNGTALGTDGAVTLIASAWDVDGSVASVEFYDGTNLLGTLGSSPFELILNSLAAGVHTLSAKATDNVGTSGWSLPVNVNVPGASGARPVFRFASQQVSVSEDSGTVILPVLLEKGIAPGVSYSTIDGTAQAVENGMGDYYRRSGYLAFTPGQSSNAIVVPIVGDYLWEPNKTFQVVLADPSEAVLGDPFVVTVTIVDDDASAATNSFLQVRLPAEPGVAGSLRVSLEPAAAGGRWRFPCDAFWRAPGLLANVQPGNYEILFKSSGGYRKPDDLLGESAVGVAPEMERAITNVYVLEQPEEGALTVQVAPEGLYGAGWRLLGDPAWNSGGQTLARLPAGEQVIEFKPVVGWATPAPLVVTVLPGVETLVGGNYLIAPDLPAGVLRPAPIQSYGLIRDSLLGEPRRPYAFCGQVRTESALGSGIAVRERVVLTAAHVVFDDVQLAYAGQIYWLFQKHAGEFEPLPAIARGVVVHSGYAALRREENTPGRSSVATEDADVAALFFYEPAARGGFSGYLMSDASPNPWLSGTRQKLIAGYPTEGQGVQPHRMHATPETMSTFGQVSNQVYATSAMLGYPGNSGGPVCVLHTNSQGLLTYYPAGIYLGVSLNQSGQPESRVRAIDSGVVDLISRAATSADIGTNQSGGVLILTPGIASGTTRSYQKLYVNLRPPAAVQAGAGWRVREYGGSYKTSPNDYVLLLSGTNYTVEFVSVPGFAAPTNSSLRVLPNQDLRLDGVYVPVGAPVFELHPVSQFGLAGRPIEFRAVVSSGTQLSAQWFFNERPVDGANAFTLRFPAVGLPHAGKYWLVASNASGAVTSTPAMLAVLAADSSGVWLAGPPGQSCRVDLSTNLTATQPWPASTRLVFDHQPVRIEGPPWTNGPARFYRPVLEP